MVFENQQLQVTPLTLVAPRRIPLLSSPDISFQYTYSKGETNIEVNAGERNNPSTWQRGSGPGLSSDD
jgi:hypothetical protein